MDYKAILRIVPTMQAASLAGEGMKLANKKKKRANDYLGYGVKAMVGSSLIKSTAQTIG